MDVKLQVFKSIYRALDDNLIEDFFKPALKISAEYNLASGYFSLSGLSELIDVLIPIIKQKGVIKIITSPVLSKSDIELIENSDDLSENIKTILLKEFENIEMVETNKLKLLAALIKENYIEMKIAIKKNGIFHDKTGYMVTKKGEIIAYNGSANMTYNGLYKNIESLSVFSDSLNNAAVSETVNYFERLWNGNYKELEIVKLPRAIKSKLLEYYDTNTSIEKLAKEVEGPNKYSPTTKQSVGSGEVKLRDYQKEAIHQFAKNEYVHFFEMATGTGKTFTALFAIEKVQIYKRNNLFTIVLLPLIDLMNQWHESAKEFGLNGKLYLIGGGASDMSPENTFTEAMLNFSDGENVTIFVVYNSYMIHLAKNLSKYQEILKDKLLIIIDEAHNVTEKLFKLLPNAKYRLGLSATPERRNLEETKNIINYFKGKAYDSTYKYTLKDAIERGYLSKYKYTPIFVHLKDYEYEEYEKETINVARYMFYKNEEDREKLKRALQRRAVIVKKSKSKIEKLENLLIDDSFNFKKSVIYCGPGNNEEDIKLTDEITQITHEKGKYDITKFTSKTKNRQNVLKLFEEGYYDTLVAIKCFDEGIDVPALSRLFILSSDNNVRQTIQRRGRVLRTSKETGKEFAEIYDFIALPPEEVDYKEAKSLIKNEILRAEEYLSLAENRDEFTYVFQSIKEEAELLEDDKIMEDDYCDT